MYIATLVELWLITFVADKLKRQCSGLQGFTLVLEINCSG